MPTELDTIAAQLKKLRPSFEGLFATTGIFDAILGATPEDALNDYDGPAEPSGPISNHFSIPLTYKPPKP